MVGCLVGYFPEFRYHLRRVTNNNELLNYVNWDGMSNYTTGKYCFPLEPGAELMLSPISPGYRIEPLRFISPVPKGRLSLAILRLDLCGLTRI